MNAQMLAALREALVKCGFEDGINAPNGTMNLDDSYLGSTDLGELLDGLVTRREKILRSVEVVGLESARQAYNDVVIAINATKCVIGTLR